MRPDSTYSYIEPSSYLFHYGQPIVALVDMEGVADGWHCYYTICGREGGVYRDMAETLLHVNERPEFTA